MDTLRVFIAVDTPPAVKRQMALLRDDLARGTGDVRWEPPEKLHCTLRFLGNVERPGLGAVERQVEIAASETPPLSLGYGGIGFFPDRARPRILWVGIRDAGGDLSRLQERISGALAGLGFAPEERPFHPHVTLGRLGSGRRWGGLTDIVQTRTFEHPPVVVPAVEIMQSVLTGRGSSYVLLRSIPLRGSGGVTPSPSG